jgi:hypothetical protein
MLRLIARIGPPFSMIVLLDEEGSPCGGAKQQK